MNLRTCCHLLPLLLLITADYSGDPIDNYHFDYEDLDNRFCGVLPVADGPLICGTSSDTTQNIGNLFKLDAALQVIWSTNILPTPNLTGMNVALSVFEKPWVSQCKRFPPSWMPMRFSQDHFIP